MNALADLKLNVSFSFEGLTLPLHVQLGDISGSVHIVCGGLYHRFCTDGNHESGGSREELHQINDQYNGHSSDSLYF